MREKDAQKRRSSEPYKKLIEKWLTRLGGNYRVEVGKEQAKIFLDRLASYSDFQIATALERCLTECLFFPNLKEVLDRMPEDTAARGPIRTCEACAPDGWRIVQFGTATVGAVRCDHAGHKRLNPSLDPTREIAREICRKLTGKEYNDLDAVDDAKLTFDVFAIANRIGYARQGIDASKWPKLEEIMYDPAMLQKISPDVFVPVGPAPYRPPEPPPKPPRWPHLIGKGINFGK